MDAVLGAEEADSDDDDGDEEGESCTQARVHGHILLRPTGRYCTRDQPSLIFHPTNTFLPHLLLVNLFYM